MSEFHPSSLDHRAFERYLAPGEEIIDVVHRHWIAAVPRSFQAFLLGVLLPGLVFWILPLQAWVMLAALFWMLIGLAWMGYEIADWFYDVFILTNRNLLLINWKNPVNVTFDRIEYDLIEAVQNSRHGTLGTLLHFGRVEIVTPNATHVLTTVRHPQMVQEHLLKVRDELAAADETHPDVETLRQALRALLDEERGTPDHIRLDERSAKRHVPQPPAVNDILPPDPVA